MPATTNTIDDDLGAHMLMQLEEEEEEEEEEFLTAATGVGLMLHGADEARALRNERRRDRRQYLVRADLLPDPRVATAWQVLYERRNDRAYITTMGLDVASFEHILSTGFAQTWDTTPIPRTDASPSASPKPYRRSLSSAGGLGLVLHYLTSTMHNVSLMEIFALIPSTVTRYIHFAMSILLKTLRMIPEGRITWPSGDEFQENNALIVARHPLLTGAFGSMDGLNLPVQTSNDQEIENATYNGWLSDHFVSSVLVFDAGGCIIACRLNAPGSWHDSRVAKPVYEKLLGRTPDGYYLVTDTAFPRGTADINGRIRAPMKSGTILPADEVERAQTVAFDQQLLSYRQTAEWGMRGLQGSFGRLRIPLPITDSALRVDILEVVVRLNNVRARLVGVNQIRSVYMPIWSVGENERAFNDFESMLFGEQRSRDRVTQYHIQVSHET